MYGQTTIANVTLAGSGSANITRSDFTATDGTALGAGDAVLVRSVIHGNDATINRIGDADTATAGFEINEQIASRTGAGERHSDSLIVTDLAGLQVVDDSGAGQDVVLIGEHVNAASVFVEMATGLANGSELTRTTAARGTDESVIELVAGGSADLVRRYDANDDAAFEIANTVDALAGGTVLTETWLSSVDISGRTNPAMQTGLVNTSGATADYLIAGTVTEN